jgi:hypothetical protein
MKISCHMDGSMSGYYHMMEDMPPDGLWDSDVESRDDGHYGGQYQWHLEHLQNYRRSHRMIHIRAQVRTVESNGWYQLDHSRRWFAAGDGSQTEMHLNRIWMDTRRWIAGDGSCEMDQERQMRINLLSYMNLRSYNRAQIYRYMVFQRHGSTEYDAKHYGKYCSEHYSEITNHAPTRQSWNAKYDPKPDPQVLQYCTHRTGHTRLNFGRATIFEVGDDSARFAITPTANNYCKANAETKLCETHSTIEKAGSSNLRRKVMANAPTNESRSRMRNKQFPLRSQFSVADPNWVSVFPRYTVATGHWLQNQS